MEAVLCFTLGSKTTASLLGNALPTWPSAVAEALNLAKAREEQPFSYRVNGAVDNACPTCLVYTSEPTASCCEACARGAGHSAVFHRRAADWVAPAGHARGFVAAVDAVTSASKTNAQLVEPKTAEMRLVGNVWAMEMRMLRDN